MDRYVMIRHIAIRGFTIVEMLVAMLVALLVMAGLHHMFVASITTEATTSSQTELDRRAQVAMDDITSRLRAAAPSVFTGAFAILEDPPRSDRICFAGAPGANLEPPANAISYWLQNGTLRRKFAVYNPGNPNNSYTGGVEVADDVTSLVFTYYQKPDAGGNQQTTQLARDTVAVKVQLKLEEGKNWTLLQSLVKLRNMG